MREQSEIIPLRQRSGDSGEDSFGRVIGGDKLDPAEGNKMLSQDKIIARREVLQALKKTKALVYSGWRDEKTQRMLVENGKSMTLFSNHRRGLAVDVRNWQECEKELNEAGLVNDIDWDKNHFAWGGEKQASEYPIIDNPKITPFFPNAVKVNFLTAGVNKEKIIKKICKVCSFYAERFFDLDWTLKEIENKFQFYSEWSGMRWINWDYLMPFGEKDAITVLFYDAGKEKGLINNTGKFANYALIQIPVNDFLMDYRLFPGLYGDYLTAVVCHELCHALHWLLTKDLSGDILDSKVIKAENEEEKLEVVRKELENLYLVYVEKKLIPIIKQKIINLVRNIRAGWLQNNI